jgi:SAM-dependent methyltransferase
MMAAAACGQNLTRAGTEGRKARLRRRFFNLQTNLTRRFDALLPDWFSSDGNLDFLDEVVPANLSRGMSVYDVGGGKNPTVGPDVKGTLELRVTGLDIDAEELARAPRALYDRTISADISRYAGEGDADLLICQALLEHVGDTEGAIRAISTILKPGGAALVFVPCRNAVYARINLLLPEALKRRILFGLFPEMSRDHGFPARYDRCTPTRIEHMAQRHGLACEARRTFGNSDYFRFLLPLHVAWRLWQALFRAVAGDEAAETFTLVLRKAAATEVGE